MEFGMPGFGAQGTRRIVEIPPFLCGVYNSVLSMMLHNSEYHANLLENGCQSTLLTGVVHGIDTESLSFMNRRRSR